MLKHFAEGAFSSRHLNLLNLHLGIVNFSQYLRTVFSAVFLLEMGLSTATVCAIMGCYIGLRWIFRAPLTLIPHYWGTKPALMIGQVMMVAGFACFAGTKGLDSWLLLAMMLNSAGEALYWHAVHTTFATLSENGKFGRQLAARGIFMSLGALPAPFVAAWLGADISLYLLTTASLLLAFIPLFFMPEPCPGKPINLSHGVHFHMGGLKMYAGLGMMSAINAVMWPMIMFVDFGHAFSRVGMLLGYVLLVSIFLSIFVARRIDLGKGQRVALLGSVLYGLVLLATMLLAHSEGSILLLLSLASLIGPIYIQPFNTSVYSWAKATNDPLWFHFWSEMGWDLGNALVLFSSAALLWAWPALNMRWLMPLALLGITMCYLTYTRDQKRTLASAAP